MSGADPTAIPERLRQVRARIASAARASGREPASVQLVAVSKFHPIESIRAALEAGQRSFGENYAQELKEKCEQLERPRETAAPGEGATAPRPEWHFLGALQSNKVKLVVGRAALIQTCDRLSLAQELNKRAAALGLLQRVLVEVNMGNEAQKGGCEIAAVPELLRQLAELPALRCEGLMCIPPAHEPPRPHFARLRALRDELRVRACYPHPLNELSMGMSADFEEAIAEGATLVRVGTAIFGERPVSTNAVRSD